MKYFIEFEFPGLSGIVHHSLLLIFGDTDSHSLIRELITAVVTYMVVSVKLDVLGSEVRGRPCSDNDFDLLVFF